MSDQETTTVFHTVVSPNRQEIELYYQNYDEAIRDETLQLEHPDVVQEAAKQNIYENDAFVAKELYARVDLTKKNPTKDSSGSSGSGENSPSEEDAIEEVPNNILKEDSTNNDNRDDAHDESSLSNRIITKFDDYFSDVEYL